jgi:hypothetical protein
MLIVIKLRILSVRYYVFWSRQWLKKAGAKSTVRVVVGTDDEEKCEIVAKWGE